MSSTVAYVVLICALYFRILLFSISLFSIQYTRKIHRKVVFSESWLGDERFKTWLKQESDCHKAVCILCNSSVIDITRMGVSAFVSHAAGAKHKQRLRTYNPISSLCFMNKNVHQKSLALLESILSCLQLSYHMLKFTGPFISFMLTLNDFFWKMFPDSESAKSFQLSKTNCAYYVVFGLVPYFKKLLVQDIKLPPFYLLLFDESLNNKLQE